MALTNKTFNDYDVTGINGSNVDYMKLKINDYKTNIDEILNKINNLIDTEYTIGFRGNQILNIRTYINDVINECKRMNSFFEDFEYTLDIDGAYLTSTQVVDGVVTATVEQASGKEVTLIAVQYDASGKTEAIKIHKETIPEGENLISFNSGLTGENIAVYVWDGVTPITVK